MSNTVDNRVVRMEFDNGQFQQKVASTVESIKNLDASLQLKNGEKGLKGVQEAAEKLTFDDVGKSLESLNNKFSVFGVAAATVISNLTNRIVGLASALVSSITIDPIKDGFREYELQLNSVQTILTNTQKYGTTIDDVNDTLGELNKYADLTIYNFGDMTRSIGQFTQAGLDLETSTTAIKGMSNLAAGSGANVQELSRAMYQMSQALAAGKIQLMDWRSMINANMGSKTFQDSLIKVAREYNTGVDAALAKQGSFNESLREGWLTTEVMVETLHRMTVEGAKGKGEFWEKQAASFEEAATKIKTFPQLIDVIKEELGSGWATSWTYIMGNFEEAKELWTSIGTPITTFIGQMHDARNEVLKFWHDVQDGEKFSGRDYFLQGLGNIVEAIHSVVAPIMDAFADIFSTITYVTDKFGHSTAELSDFGKGVGQTLVDISKGFAEVTSSWKMGEGYYKSVKAIFTGIFTVAKTLSTILGQVLTHAVDILGRAFGVLIKVLNVIFDVIVSIGGPVVDLLGKGLDALVGLLKPFVGLFEALVDALTPLGDFLTYSAHAVGDFIKSLSDGQPVADAWVSLTKRLSFYFDAFQKHLGPVAEAFAKIADTIRGELTPQTDDLGNVTQNTYTRVINKFNEFAGVIEFVGGLLSGFIDDTKTALDHIDIFGKITSGADTAKTSFTGLFGESGESASDFIGKLTSGLDDAKAAFDDFVSNIKPQDVVLAISGAFVALTAFNVGGILKNIRKVVKGFGDGVGDIEEFIKNLSESVVGVVDSFSGYIKDLGKAAKLKSVAEVIKALAIAIAAMAGSLFLLSTVDPDALDRSVKALITVAAAMGVIALLLTRMPVESLAQFTGLVGMAGNLVAVGIAMVAIAGAAKIFSSMDMEGLIKGLGSIILVTVALVKALQVLAPLSKELSTLGPIAGVIFAMGMALGAVATACLIFNFVKWESMAKAGLALLSLVLAATALSFVSDHTGSFLKLAGSLGILGFVMGEFAVVCLAFSIIPFWGIGQALIALYGIISAAEMMSKITANMKKMAALAGVLGIISTAMIGLGVACLIFSAVKLEGMIAAGAALAGMVLAIEALAEVGTKKTEGLAAAAAALPSIGIGLAIFGATIAGLGSMPWQAVVLGIVEMAAGLAVLLGLAAVASLGPVTAGLTALSASLLSIGAGVALAGVGILSLTLGLATLAAIGPAACAALIAALSALGEGLVAMFVTIGVKMSEGIVVVTEAFAAAGPRFLSAGHKLVDSWQAIVNDGLIVEMGRVAGAMVVQFLAGIGELAGSLIAGGAAMLVEVLHGIADHIGEIADAGLATAIAFINGLADAIKNNASAIWDALGNLLWSIMALIADGVARLIEMIPGVGADIAKTMRDYWGVTTEAAEEVSEKTTEAAKPKEGEISGAYEDELDKTAAKAKEGGEKIVDQLGKTGQEGSAALFDHIENLPDQLQGVLAQSSQTISQADLETVTSGEGKAAVAAFSQEIQKIKGTASEAVQSALKALNAVNFGTPAKKQGSDAKSGFEKGINKDGWRAAGATAAAAAKGGMGSQNLYGSGYNIGSNLAQGLINGMKDKLDDIREMSKKVGEASHVPAEKETGISSPSRVMMRMGRYLGEGLIIGMQSMQAPVENQAAEMGLGVKTSVSTALQALDGIDWDASPTITPVLDTSLVDEGLAGILGGSPVIETGFVAGKFETYSAGTQAQQAQVQTAPVYNFNMQYNAGEDANEIVRDIAVAVRQNSLL